MRMRHLPSAFDGLADLSEMPVVIDFATPFDDFDGFSALYP
jgi:hypothetical protein